MTKNKKRETRQERFDKTPPTRADLKSPKKDKKKKEKKLKLPTRTIHHFYSEPQPLKGALLREYRDNGKVGKGKIYILFCFVFCELEK